MTVRPSAEPGPANQLRRRRLAMTPSWQADADMCGAETLINAATGATILMKERPETAAHVLKTFMTGLFA